MEYEIKVDKDITKALFHSGLKDGVDINEIKEIQYYKKQETRNKKQETRNKKQETRNKKQETRNKKQET